MNLVVVDTVRIQRYIFGSNRLRENYGASHLVAQATSTWALDAILTATSNSNNIAADGSLDQNRWIERDGIAAEALYAGGGNFVALFQTAEAARDFTRALSSTVLQYAPNLHLRILHGSFEWDRESLHHKIDSMMRSQGQLGFISPISVPLLGLGVTAMCRSTGLPASGMAPRIGSDPPYPASSEILAKIEASPEAVSRLRRDIRPPDGYDYPTAFDELGRTEHDYSYIAVVHADGNDMGARIWDIGKRHTDNRDYIIQLRMFSDGVREAATRALQETVHLLAHPNNIDFSRGQMVYRNQSGRELVRINLRANHEGKGWLLPFRPLVFGGDDVTFVCDGRLGLSLAIEYLERFEQLSAELIDRENPITSCAGVAITKVHYPFSRAYQLADALCQSAKQYRRDQETTGSYLDWHFARGGLYGSIETIREREYTVEEGLLTLRPVALGENQERHRTWHVVSEGIRAFQSEDWTMRRNKLKGLRDSLRRGAEQVRFFRMKYNENNLLPSIEPSMTDWQEEGWHGRYCGYFDALELADWFVPLVKDGAP